MKNLIDLRLSGKSASHILDALMEELPPLPALGASIQRVLPRDTKVKIEDDTVYIYTQDRESIQEVVNYLELAYPELEFVVETSSLGKVLDASKRASVVAFKKDPDKHVLRNLQNGSRIAEIVDQLIEYGMEKKSARELVKKVKKDNGLR